MKVSLTQENLNKALQVAGRVVGSRSTLPVLANVLITTDNNRLKLSSTNLEIGVNYWVGAKVEKEGAITVPARLLSDFVNNLPGGINIELTLDKTSLKIEAGQYKSSINGINSEEFPTIPSVNGDSVVKIPNTRLAGAIEQVVGVASSDDARPVLTGVYLKSDKDQLLMVATDSYRLAEKKLKTPKNSGKFEVIVPAKTMQELQRIAGEEDKEIEILADENQIMFRFGDVELISRLIEGEFPKYESLIPEKANTTLKLKKDDFIAIAKVANLFARESAGSVALKADPERGQIELSSIASQVGENTSTTQAEVKGEEAEVSLNCRYLLEALGAIETENVEFGITGKINPCVVRPEGQDDYLHVIMPLRS